MERPRGRHLDSRAAREEATLLSARWHHVKVFNAEGLCYECGSQRL